MPLPAVDLVAVLVTAVWAMLPAYVPNNVAVVVGGGRAIDGGRTWRGRRLFGDGKTWRGTVAGVVTGAALALLLNVLRPALTSVVGFSLPLFPFPAVLTMPLGAMLGDVVASFVKRRTGRERGAPFPLLDQLDFAVGALVLTAIVVPAWFFSVFTVPVLVAVAVLTPLLHVGTNVVGYALGLKAEPW